MEEELIWGKRFEKKIRTSTDVNVAIVILGWMWL